MINTINESNMTAANEKPDGESAGRDADDDPAEPPSSGQVLRGSIECYDSDPTGLLEIEITFGLDDYRESDSTEKVASDAMRHVDTTSLIETVRSAAELLAIKTGRLTLCLVNDAEMTQLHRDFCGIDSTTDVLTFSLNDDVPEGVPSRSEPHAPRHIDTDIAICVDEAHRQACARGHEVTRELLLYAVHGMLHALGYDDHTDDEYRLMHETEDELLARLGVGPTFHREVEASADTGASE